MTHPCGVSCERLGRGLPVKFFNVKSLHLLPRLSIEYCLWSLPRDLFEHSSVKFTLEVRINEILDFRELKNCIKRLYCWQHRSTLFKRHPEQDSMTHLYIELSSHSSPFSPSTSSSSARTRRLQLSRARPTSRYFFIICSHFFCNIYWIISRQ